MGHHPRTTRAPPDTPMTAHAAAPQRSCTPGMLAAVRYPRSVVASLFRRHRRGSTACRQDARSTRLCLSRDAVARCLHSTHGSPTTTRVSGAAIVAGPDLAFSTPWLCSDAAPSDAAAGITRWMSCSTLKKDGDSVDCTGPRKPYRRRPAQLSRR